MGTNMHSLPTRAGPAACATTFKYNPRFELVVHGGTHAYISVYQVISPLVDQLYMQKPQMHSGDNQARKGE